MSVTSSALLVILCPAPATAAPIQVTFAGAVMQVAGPANPDLTAAFPYGTAVTGEVRFNETFFDGDVSFKDNVGPAAGRLTVDETVFELSGARINGFASAPSATGGYTPTRVDLLFSGAGPDIGNSLPGATGDGTFYGFVLGIPIEPFSQPSKFLAGLFYQFHTSEFMSIQQAFTRPSEPRGARVSGGAR